MSFNFSLSAQFHEKFPENTAKLTAFSSVKMNGNLLTSRGSPAFERSRSEKGIADTQAPGKDVLNPSSGTQKHANLMETLLLNGEISEKRLIASRKRRTAEAETDRGSDVTGMKGQRGGDASEATEIGDGNGVKIEESESNKTKDDELSATVSTASHNSTRSNTTVNSNAKSVGTDDVTAHTQVTSTAAAPVTSSTANAIKLPNLTAGTQLRLTHVAAPRSGSTTVTRARQISAATSQPLQTHSAQLIATTTTARNNRKQTLRRSKARKVLKSGYPLHYRRSSSDRWEDGERLEGMANLTDFFQEEVSHYMHDATLESV